MSTSPPPCKDCFKRRFPGPRALKTVIFQIHFSAVSNTEEKTWEIMWCCFAALLTDPPIIYRQKKLFTQRTKKTRKHVRYIPMASFFLQRNDSSGHRRLLLNKLQYLYSFVYVLIKHFICEQKYRKHVLYKKESPKVSCFKRLEFVVELSNWTCYFHMGPHCRRLPAFSLLSTST